MAIVDHKQPAGSLSADVKKPGKPAAGASAGLGGPGGDKPKAGTDSPAAGTATTASASTSGTPLITRASSSDKGGDYTARLASTGYNYTAMVNYMHQYWYYYNTAYKAYGNDCTNFVSQALKAGGWSFNDYGGSYLANDQWYYYPYVATRSWTSTPDFFVWATSGSGRTYELSYLNSMGPADVEIADWEGDGLKDHTMMVTSWAAGGAPGGYNDIRVTYHTNDTRDISIWTLYSNHPSGIWYALRT
jgi:hypothetical protein